MGCFAHPYDRRSSLGIAPGPISKLIVPELSFAGLGQQSHFTKCSEALTHLSLRGRI